MNRQIDAFRIRKIASRVAFIAIIVCMLFVMFFPIAVLVTTSLKTQQDVFSLPVKWISDPPQFKNYVDVFRKMHVGTGFQNSIIVTFVTILMILGVGIPAAYAFSSLDFPGKRILYFITLVSQMFAPMIVLIPLYRMLNSVHLIDSRFGLVLMNTVFNLAFIVLMLKATFDGIPREVMEAARIDGCTTFGTMVRIFIPVSSTGIAVAVIFAFTRTWNEFLFAFTFTSSQEKKTIIVSLYEILKNNPAFGIPWHYVMAGAVITTVPLVVLFICIRNYITGGHTAGAIK